MVLGGNCEACQTGLCSCSSMDAYYDLYNWQSWTLFPLLLSTALALL